MCRGLQALRRCLQPGAFCRLGAGTKSAAEVPRGSTCGNEGRKLSPALVYHHDPLRGVSLPERNRADMPTEDKKNKTIAVVTYPGVALLDLVATKTVLDSLAIGTRYRSVTVGERTEPIASNTPMRIIPEKRFEEVPDPFAIIVPGGGANALKAMGDERLINYLRSQSTEPSWSARCQPVLSSLQQPVYSKVGRRPPTQTTQSNLRTWGSTTSKAIRLRRGSS